jgi:GNAT superfamily N-acetyltransferase
MDKAELLKIFDREQRLEVQVPGVIRENTGRVIRHRSLQERHGFIAYSALDETCADAEIDAQVAFFASVGVPFEWKVYDYDRPADLTQRLAARGFVIEEPEALVVLDVDEAPDFYWSLDLPENVLRVTTPAGVAAIIRMEEEVWQESHAWLGERLVRDLETTPDQISIFAVQADGRTVSAAWVYFHPPTQFASLWGGSTLPAYRGRGCYTALLVARARESRQRGYRFLTVDASPMSRPILEKRGFQYLGFSTPCQWSPLQAKEGEHA